MREEEKRKTEELVGKLEDATERARRAALDFSYSDKLFRFSERVELILATFAVRFAADELKKHLALRAGF